MDHIDIKFDNTFYENMKDFFQSDTPDSVTAPALVYFNNDLANYLKLPIDSLGDQQKADVFSGNAIIKGSQPLAQAYAGHQFGQFNPQLGDGRALILGEVLANDGDRFDLCLKGSGRTAYSRGGDGKAALGPMLREVLVGQAMHALGIPTTQSLAVVTTGELVYREEALPGAVLTRVAASHLRIGTFELCAAQRDKDRLQQLADYAIARHFPQLALDDAPYLEFLKAVIERQAQLIAQWMSVGFIHGVMNTDNMLISGETIDYGPCAFMDAYNPRSVFSSIDRQGRYAYLNQPGIAQWNLTRFAEALLPLIDDDIDTAVALATTQLKDFSVLYDTHWSRLMFQKLGLNSIHESSQEPDTALIDDWLQLLETQQVDYTLAFRYLADAVTGNTEQLDSLFSGSDSLQQWLTRWRQVGATQSLYEDNNQRVQAMKAVNPLVIPRNHLVEKALNLASDENDYSFFEYLLNVMKNPFADTVTDQELLSPAAPEFTQAYKTFCGT